MKKIPLQTKNTLIICFLSALLLLGTICAFMVGIIPTVIMLVLALGLYLSARMGVDFEKTREIAVKKAERKQKNDKK